jgi:hypothetical protein
MSRSVHLVDLSHVYVCITMHDSENVKIDKKRLSCNQVFHLFCFLCIFDWPSMFYWYALLAGSVDTRTVRCVVTATTPRVSLRFAKTTATAAETATEGITRRACTRLVLLPFTN